MVEELSDLHHVRTVDGALGAVAEVGNVRYVIEDLADQSGAWQRSTIVVESR